MRRLQATFANLKKQNKKALIPYITAGDPDLKTTLTLMHSMAANGADIIELGFPFSDPVADGPVIQGAHYRALKSKTTLKSVLATVKSFRQTNQQTPIVLMGYLNPIECMGYKHFIDAAKTADIDALLVVDLPVEESYEMCEQLKAVHIDPIFLIAPNTNNSRISLINQEARGYIYYVTLKGVTGAKSLNLEAIGEKIYSLREQIQLPIACGFGISDEKSAKAVATYADAIIIGSAIVKIIGDYSSDPKQLLIKVDSFIGTIRKALDSLSTFSN